VGEARRGQLTGVVLVRHVCSVESPPQQLISTRSSHPARCGPRSVPVAGCWATERTREGEGRHSGGGV
jgi:hypothetical protein